MLPLHTICDVLGCQKPTASQLKNGKYARPNSDLLQRYQALCAAVQTHSAQDQAAVLRETCRVCDRTSCDGCRLAEIL